MSAQVEDSQVEGSQVEGSQVEDSQVEDSPTSPGVDSENDSDYGSESSLVTLVYEFPSPTSPTSDANPQLWKSFQAVDIDGSGTISAAELKEALADMDSNNNCDLDTVKMLMTIFDTDHNGTIDFTEFAGLWKYIEEWKTVFRHFDADRSGFIDGNELHHALANFGYKLSSSLLHLISQKYAGAPDEQGQTGGITFDRFVRACVVLKTATDLFKKKDEDEDGVIRMTYEECLDLIFSLP